MDLASYRQSAESFLAELNAEYYRHYGGLQSEYQIEPIYERHAALFERSAVDALHAAAEAAPPDTDERRRLTILLDFAADGFIGQATKELEAEIARREASISLQADGERVGFREARVAQANQPDPQLRAAVETSWLEALETNLNPLYEELVGRQHEFANELGFQGYAAMCATLKGIDLAALQQQTDAFRAATERRYPEIVEPEFRRTLGLGVGEVRRSDLPRFFRAADQDDQFAAAQLVPSFIETARGLGFDVTRQRGVVLDTELRANKSPRAFCAPVRIPGEIYLVISPVGGRDDFAALFHEGGHTEHFANVDEQLPFEYRCLGDNSITESYAFLFDHLIEDPEWLARRLLVEDPESLLEQARAYRMVYLRRYVGKLAYERELHADGAAIDPGIAGRYARLLGGALLMEWPTQPFLADVDTGFYSACYLRAWALERELRAHLRERFGSLWFEQREAGELLRSLWRGGQRLDADELLAQVTGRALDFAALADDYL